MQNGKHKLKNLQMNNLPKPKSIRKKLKSFGKIFSKMFLNPIG